MVSLLFSTNKYSQGGYEVENYKLASGGGELHVYAASKM
jgi:hypothetical protein